MMESAEKINVIADLLTQWHLTKQCMNEMLCKELNLSQSNEVLSHEPKSGSLRDDWQFTVHGSEVDVHLPNGLGGIRYDFHTDVVNEIHLYDFVQRQRRIEMFASQRHIAVLQSRELFSIAYQEWAFANLGASEVSSEIRIQYGYSKVLKTKNYSEMNLIEETFAEFENRYEGFGQLLFTVLRDECPRIFSATRWYLDGDDDGVKNCSFAVCGSTIPFAVQLDCLTDVIHIWDKDDYSEIGYWCKEPYKEALELIQEFYL